MTQYQRVKLTFYFYKRTRTASSFETALWDLMFKADGANLQLIGVGFPYHLMVFNDYMRSPSEEEFLSEYTKEASSEQ